MKKFRIINEGDEDCNLWVVLDGREAVFSSRSYYLAQKFIVDNGGSL